MKYFKNYPSCIANKPPYYCPKSESFSLNELKQFPTLYLEHTGFDYTFELTYQDLFVNMIINTTFY